MSSASQNNRIKICFTCSSGGHLNELMGLSELIKSYDCFFITERVTSSESILVDRSVYWVPQIRRRELALMVNLVKAVLIASRVLREERPNVVISTGALCTVPVMIVGKLIGSKIIYIESQARVHTLSATGKLARRIADCFFVQWEELLSVVPEARYEGML